MLLASLSPGARKFSFVVQWNVINYLIAMWSWSLKFRRKRIGETELKKGLLLVFPLLLLQSIMRKTSILSSIFLRKKGTSRAQRASGIYRSLAGRSTRPGKCLTPSGPWGPQTFPKVINLCKMVPKEQEWINYNYTCSEAMSSERWASIDGMPFAMKWI